MIIKEIILKKSQLKKIIEEVLKEEKYTFSAMTMKPDNNNYHWFIYKDSEDREFYPVAFSAKLRKDSSFTKKLKKIVDDAVK